MSHVGSLSIDLMTCILTVPIRIYDFSGLDEIVEFVTSIGCKRWIRFASDKACLRYL